MGSLLQLHNETFHRWANLFGYDDTYNMLVDTEGYGLVMWDVERYLLPGLVRWKLPTSASIHHYEESETIIDNIPVVEVDLLDEDYGFSPVHATIPWSDRYWKNSLNVDDAIGSWFSGLGGFHPFLPAWEVTRIPQDLYDSWHPHFERVIEDMNYITYHYDYWCETSCEDACTETASCQVPEGHIFLARCCAEEYAILEDKWTHRYFSTGYMQELTQNIENNLFSQGALFQQTVEYAKTRHIQGWGNANWLASHAESKETQKWFQLLVSQFSPY